MVASATRLARDLARDIELAVWALARNNPGVVQRVDVRHDALEQGVVQEILLDISPDYSYLAHPTIAVRLVVENDHAS